MSGYKGWTGRGIGIAMMLAFAGMHTARAMTVDKLLDAMREAYEQQRREIKDYTLVVAGLAGRQTVYHQKYTEEGQTRFRVRNEQGVSSVGFFPGLEEDALRRAGRYAGRETRDGTELHVIAIDEITDSDPDHEMDEPQVRRNVRLYIEPDKWVVRRLTYEMDADLSVVEPGLKGRGLISVHSDDYRDVQGMWIAHRTVMSTRILEDDLRDRFQAAIQQILEQVEQRLRELQDSESPPAHAERMTRMLESQKKAMKATLRGEFVTEVEAVRVNTGLPDNQFLE